MKKTNFRPLFTTILAFFSLIFTGASLTQAETVKTKNIEASAPAPANSPLPSPAPIAPANKSSNSSPEVAKEDLSQGFKSVGSGLKHGAVVTGSVFKNWGVAIKDYFAGTKSSSGSSSGSVQEKDLNSAAKPFAENPPLPAPTSTPTDLDTVGNSGSKAKPSATKESKPAAQDSKKSNF